MLETLKQWQEKIDARIMRERALIFVSALAFIFMLWNFAVQVSIDKKSNEITSQLSSLASQRTAMQTQVAAITQSLLNDPDKQKKAQIAQLQIDIKQMEDKVQNASRNLIRADQLPQALQEVLQKTSQLSLLEVKTLPAQELQLNQPVIPKVAAESAIENNSAGVYQHAVELHVSGTYPQLIQFLQALEQLPWRFYWQSLDYHVEHYPAAETVLRVYTLSSEEGLLGV